MTDHARRIVELIGDKWIQPGAKVLGKVDSGSLRIIEVRDHSQGFKDFFGVESDEGKGSWWWGFVAEDMWPDLTDPATWGILLSLLPEGWEIDRDWCELDGTQWSVGNYSDTYNAKVSDLHSFPTKIDALIAALEASK